MEGKDTKILRRVRGQPILRDSTKRGPGNKAICTCTIYNTYDDTIAVESTRRHSLTLVLISCMITVVI